MQPFFGKWKVKELFLENLAFFSKNMEKSNNFGENFLKKYFKTGVIYEVKNLVRNKSISKSRIIPKSGFYYITLHQFNYSRY